MDFKKIKELVELFEKKGFDAYHSVSKKAEKEITLALIIHSLKAEIKSSKQNLSDSEINNEVKEILVINKILPDLRVDIKGLITDYSKKIENKLDNQRKNRKILRQIKDVAGSAIKTFNDELGLFRVKTFKVKIRPSEEPPICIYIGGLQKKDVYRNYEEEYCYGRCYNSNEINMVKNGIMVYINQIESISGIVKIEY